jgi:hypothetical protein
VILRPHEGGTLLIGQPAHARLSAQLARAWGTPELGGFEPHAEVCLAALQHDIGMATWDAEPELDPRSGLPYAFSSMPRELHVSLWRNAATLVLAQSRYAALLVSLHGTGLYERFVSAQERGREPVRSYLREQDALQRRLRRSLAADPDEVERNRALVSCWDWLSLFLCEGAQELARMDEVPACGGATALSLRRTGEGAVAVAPWPFAAPRLDLCVEGRLLEGRYDDQATMRAALAEAPWTELELELRPERG